MQMFRQIVGAAACGRVRAACGFKKRALTLAAALVAAAGPGETVRLTNGWRFQLNGETAARAVTVPHDWAVERGFLSDRSDPHHGALPYVGKGLYRRAFDGFRPPEGGRTYLTLDGVQCRSVVKLNGKVVGGRPFGYASETIDVTDALKPSGNVLEVEAENVANSSRWYPGSGIFRDVTVRVCPPDHVRPNTLFVRTLSATERSAEMAVSFEWRGGTSNFTFRVANPRLWSPESPSLYELELFGETFRYGIRTAAFDPQKGFFLNGVHRQMRGVCLHHDLGPLGAAFDRDAARRQLTLLKEMGCDAIRTSHNPPAAALLDLCDEMGVLVMDEAFDMWELEKGDYSKFWNEWHARDLAEFVRRDRSHPCVVMWSIGNELREHAEKNPARAIRIANELTAIVRANDATRPVTFGCWKNAPMWNGCQNTVDAFGANYQPFMYAEFLRRNPKVGLVGTETCSIVSSRGEYFFPVVASPIRSAADLRRRRDEGRDRMIRGAQMSGYDLWGPHPNNCPPDVEFECQDRNPQVYGEFVWTGFDYLGEPDPCAKRGGRSSYFGIFDLAGFPKDRYWLYRSQWRPDVPTAHILPHWTWPGREGEVTPVHVYTSGDEAELFVNGVSQGRKRRGPYVYRLCWDDVRYEPGEVRVKTWRKGEPWAEDVVRTAGAPVRVERTERRFGRLAFVTLALRDANGTLCPNADRTLTFATKPGARLVALCNGDPASYENFRSNAMRTFHGLLLAIVEGEAADLTVCEPGWGYRGFLLDEGRHFFGKRKVKEYLDLMAEKKMNRFHWHLTEDQGWRLDLPGLPELAKCGAKRPASPKRGQDFEPDGVPYGPFAYTPEDIREIVAYAAERGITVVPEIDFPGHVRALLAAHPEFACHPRGELKSPSAQWGIHEDVLCLGNPEAVRYVERVVDEVLKLFPGPYVNLCGDECPTNAWSTCAKCRARKEREGLKDFAALQGSFAKRLAEHLVKKGRRPMFCDEVVGTAELPKETVVWAWHGGEAVRRAAAAGHDVVVSTLEETYFSIPEGRPDDPWPYRTWVKEAGMQLPVDVVRRFDPGRGLPPELRKRVLGGVCCAWTEEIASEAELDFKTKDRLAAFGETLSNGPVRRPVVHVDADAGDDAGDGSAAHPFRSPERARARVRELKAEPEFAGAEVALCGTFSYPTNTFELTAEDGGGANAPVVWRSGLRRAAFEGAFVFAPDEFRLITEAKVLARLKPEVRDRVCVLDLRARGIELPAMPDKFLSWDACELYCRSRTLTLAREPNRGWYEITAEQEVDRGVQAADKSKGREFEWGVRGGTFAYAAGFAAPETWPVADGVWLYGYFCMDWYSEAVRVGRVDRAKRHVTFAGTPFYGVGVPDEWKPYVQPRRYYAFNFLEAVDAPGEWYVDRAAGKLYLYPADGGEVRLAVRREPVLRIAGARHLTVQGLSVAYSAATNAVDVVGAEDVVLKDLTVSRTMGNGVRIEGGRGVSLVRSHVRDVGCGWVRVSGGDRRTLRRADHRVTACEFDHCGRNSSVAVGLGVGGTGVRIDANRIHDTPYIAVRYDGNELQIDGNEIWCAMMEGGDGGAIYTGRDWGSQGCVVSNNYVHHLGASGAAWRRARGLPVEYASDARPQDDPMTMGVYLDDCDSGDVIVDNVFEETGFGVFVGGGRHNFIRRNTMIRCKVACHLDTRGIDRARPGRGIPKDSWDLLAKIERLGFRSSPWKERYPWLLAYMDDEPLLPLHTEFTDNTAIACDRFFSLTGKRMPETLERLRVTGNRAFGMGAPARAHMNH